MKTSAHKRLLALTGLLLLDCSPLLAGEPAANGKCVDCHGDKDLTKDLPDGKTRSLFTDEAVLKRSVHAKVLCAECHADVGEDHPGDETTPQPVDCAKCHERQSHSFGAGVHGAARQRGDATVPGCADCHGTHDVLPRRDAGSLINAANLAKTCGACHVTAAADVQASVHGKAMAKGEVDAATCLDCHAEHRITKLSGEEGMVRSAAVCANCHASEKINSRFGLPDDRVRTFNESFHGLAAQGKSTVAANCASCHGYHRILPSKDPASTIHPTRLMETCGKCHPGASAHFVEGKIHSVEAGGGGIGEVVNHWVKIIYLWLIGITVVLLGAHNGLIWWRKVAAIRRGLGETIERMDFNQRLQHLVLMVSFILLAVTGFALKFPNTWYAHLMGSEDIRRSIHRIAGLVMLAGGLYHVGYALFTANGRRLVCDLFPRWQDLRDVRTNIGHLLLDKPKAKFGRFGYPEKIEYWAVVWGTVVMGATGLAIWFKIDVTHWLPRWVVDVSVTIHYYEAILACLAIVIWHFYHVMFDPDVYPMNFAWLNGRVPKKWHHEEHELAEGEGGEARKR
jgi:cytochrome b subunit of formate dehydrogenase